MAPRTGRRPAREGESPLEPRPRQVDEYSLGSLLGVGLTGATYLATRSGPDGHLRQVALKLCDARRGLLLPWAARFMEDLDPRLVRYEAVGPPGRRWSGYWVTDVVRAEPLDSVIDGAPLGRRLRALAEVAEAVAALHRARVVHGHLLPQNVLVRRERGGALTPLLTDIGVRLRLDPTTHDEPGAAARLYPYLAPEAVTALDGPGLDAQEALEPPADVYALGGLLCALLTGLGPGLAEGERGRAQILRSKARRTYFVAALLDPEEPIDLERSNDLLQRSLAPRAGDRPTAGEFAQALRAALLQPEHALP